MIDIQITEEPLDAAKCLSAISSHEAGGNAVFIGTVRNQPKGKEVLHLDFEAYEPMAIKEMHKIAARCMKRWELIGLAIHHRTGRLQLGEVPVVIAVASAHRKNAFEACEFAIDELKKSVPIWKREFFENGDLWVAAHP